MKDRRVVVTGMGVITPVGLNVADNWSAILDGQSGITNITKFPTDRLSCKIAGIIQNFNTEDYIDAKDIRKMDQFIHYGIAAAIEAVEDSGWKPEDEESQDRTGVLIGSGIGGLRSIEATSIAYHQSDKNKVSPFFIPASLINLLSGHVSIRYRFSGPNTSVVTACSTGAHAIGDAARLIKYGDADVMVAGGAESPITPVGVAGFASARALATNYNDKPKEASRPWDQGHDGFVMGEGAGIVVLEEYEHAKKRGAKIYAEIVGYGLTGDAYHITAPSGRGAKRAMENALKDGNIEAEKIGYINAHGTSTKVGDAIELNMVQEVFKDNPGVLMSSTKSAIGHLLGAAGGVEAIYCILALKNQVAPPTLNLHNPISEAKIDLVPLNSKEFKAEYALTNSFGFGGTNASLLLGKL